MSAPDQPTPPDFDEDFLQAIAKWKEQFKIKDDDPILLLLDLFRIHQNHWDEIRHRQMPSLDEFEKDIAALTEATKILKERALKEIRAVDLPTAICAAFTAAHRRFSHRKIPMKLDFIPFPLGSSSGLVQIAARLRAWVCHFAVNHHCAAFAAMQSPCRPTWRPDLETQSILSRLAHHRRHRLRQNHFRHQSTGASGISK